MKYLEDFVNHVINGDCLEILPSIPNESIDLIVTDPPYQFGIGTVKNPKGGGFYKHEKKRYIQNIEDDFGLEFNPKIFLNSIKRVMKKINIYIFTNRHLLSNYIEFAQENKCHFEILIWKKTNPVPINNGHYLFDKEFIVFIKEKGGYFNSKLGFKDYSTFFEHSIGTKETKHPTEKPIEIIERIIKISSNLNDIILDPFLGSGTTTVACKKLNRRFIGIEINPEYCKIAEERLKKVPERLDNILKAMK